MPSVKHVDSRDRVAVNVHIAEAHNERLHMSTGRELLTLKRSSQSAEAALEKYKRGRSELRLGAVALAVVLLVFGGSVSVAAFHLADSGVLTIGVGCVASAALLLFAAFVSLTSKTDKKKAKLEQDDEDASISYLSALWTELASYGVETKTIEQRTDRHSESYEITAVRNGSPIDVSVREFNDELIFMLNGERMSKPVSV